MTGDDSNGLEVIRAYVAGQARLGYGQFDPGPEPEDIILATFPKSGSTWTSYLLHQLKSGGDDDFDDIKHVVVDITPGHWDPAQQPFAAPQAYSPRTYKTHGSYRLCPKGARYLYVSRDPVDIFWSLYQFIHDLLGIAEPVAMDAFYRDFFVRRFDTGHDIGNVWDHILDWHRLVGQENMLWLHYEDLVGNREHYLPLIARHMGIDIDGAALRRVIANSSMEHMRTISRQLNPSPDNYVGRIVAEFGDLTAGYAKKMAFGKLRKGVAGDGAGSVPAEIRAEMAKEWRERITPVLGFEDYRALRSAAAARP